MPHEDLPPEEILHRGCAPGISNWPALYRLLDRVRTASDCEICTACSLQCDRFALVPLFAGEADHMPIIIEKRFDTDSLSNKVADFANGNLAPLSDARKARLGNVNAPRSFELFDIAQVSSNMRIGFACSVKRNYTFAILRFVKGMNLRPILFEERWDDASVHQVLSRFAEGSYPQLDIWVHLYNRAIDISNAAIDRAIEAEQLAKQHSGGKHVRGYSSDRPNVKLPTQADWGDS